MPVRNADRTFDIPKSVLHRHMKTPTIQMKGLTAIGVELEEFLVKTLKTCGKWGYHMDPFDLR